MEHIIHLYSSRMTDVCDHFDVSRNTSCSIQAQRTAFVAQQIQEDKTRG